MPHGFKFDLHSRLVQVDCALQLWVVFVVDHLLAAEVFFVVDVRVRNLLMLLASPLLHPTSQRSAQRTAVRRCVDAASQLAPLLLPRVKRRVRVSVAALTSVDFDSRQLARSVFAHLRR